MGTAMSRQSPQARAESKFSAYAVGGDGFVSRLNAERRFCYAGGWGSLCLWRQVSSFETDPGITSNLEVNLDETKKKSQADQKKSNFTSYCRGAGTEVHRDCVVFRFAAKTCPHALHLF